MKNQRPFMFLTRRGFHATAKIHDLTAGTVRQVNSETDCRGDHELSAYRECVSRGEVITMGTTIVEPIR